MNIIQIMYLNFTYVMHSVSNVTVIIYYVYVLMPNFILYSNTTIIYAVLYACINYFNDV